MDESKCLMLLKSKHNNNNNNINLIKDRQHHNISTIKPSWKHHIHHHREEHVGFFDTTGCGGGGGDGGGGCIWPPRSYACSFCKRVFKSAQALGGHMNVHRRDRALLKQQVITTTINNNNNNNISKINNNDNSNNNNNSNSKSCLINSYCSKSSTNKSMIVGQNNQFHVRVPKKSYVSHKTLSNVSSNCSQSSRNNVIEKNFRGERDDRYLSYKRCRSNGGGGGVALLPSFVDGKIEHCSNIEDDVVGVPRILGVKGARSNSMDDLDLELRLGSLPQNA
ncbi:hypothetical protein vseg_005540 [Gypsophila vaccaria]